MNPILLAAIEKRGFDFVELPQFRHGEGIPKQWESFPIVKAIREAEKETCIKYYNPLGEA